MLSVVSGSSRGKELLVAADRFRVGKSPQNDLVLPDETVSRFHFEVIREEAGYLVRDVGSTNGTILDGARVREGFLKSGSTITAGRVRVQVLLPTEPAPTLTASPDPYFFDPDLSFRQTKEAFVAEFERRYVAWLLERAGGNLSSAARMADMDRKHLHKLRRKHGL